MDVSQVITLQDQTPAPPSTPTEGVFVLDAKNLAKRLETSLDSDATKLSAESHCLLDGVRKKNGEEAQ